MPLPDFGSCFPTGYSSANGVFGLYISGAGQFNQGKQGTVEQRQINLVDNLSVTAGQPPIEVRRGLSLARPFTSPFSYQQYRAILRNDGRAGRSAFGNGGVRQACFPHRNALLSQNFSLYGQDTWRVRPRFTMTYGLRWDVNPPLKGKNAANDPSL